MKPLAIIAYFDGRLGHEKQTRGILQAMAEITAVAVTGRKIRVSPAASAKNWAAYLLASLPQNFGGGKYPEPADLIIGTGTRTHMPMLSEKKRRCRISGKRVRVVTCMSPDALLRDGFDLCCIPRHDEPPVRHNIFVTLGPPNPLKSENRHQPDRGLILVGGVDRKSHRWDTGTVVEQVRTIAGRDPARKWTVSSSPRTPEDTCRQLAAMADSLPQLVFFSSAETPAGWIEEQYAENAVVWVTADSVSMVYEALTAGCSVGILPVAWQRPQNKFQMSLDILHRGKSVVDYNEWLQGAGLPAVPAQPINEAARCAREILRRWWPDRLR